MIAMEEEADILEMEEEAEMMAHDREEQKEEAEIMETEEEAEMMAHDREEEENWGMKVDLVRIALKALVLNAARERGRGREGGRGGGGVDGEESVRE